MSVLQRGVRIGLLMAAVAGWVFWASHHTGVTFADGLRAVEQARAIEGGDYRGGLLGALEHPLHPLAIAVAHRVLGGGDGPYAWQTAAQAATALALVLAVVPVYLLGRDLYDEPTATLGCVLVFGNPVLAYVAVNVLGESTFLLCWAWGLWGAVRFLRDGHCGWLPPTVLFGSLAYLARPEGALLYASLVATLVLLPWHGATRIDWPRWSAALAFLVLGPALLLGPYVAAKGGVATRPAVARLIGFAPEAPATGLERERPLPPGRTKVDKYVHATRIAVRACEGLVTPAFAPLALVGLAAGGLGAGRRRSGLFLGVVLLASVAGLVRLQATGGYCTVRHALVPGLVLILAAARGGTWLAGRCVVEGRWFGLGAGRWRPGPAVWVAGLVALLAWPYVRSSAPYGGPFTPYRLAGDWIAGRPEAEGRVLDLTDWSLFFSGRQGFRFKDVLAAAHDLRTRFVVVRMAQLRGHGHASAVVRGVLAGRTPVARFPEGGGRGVSPVLVFDLGETGVAVGASGGLVR